LAKSAQNVVHISCEVVGHTHHIQQTCNTTQNIFFLYLIYKYINIMKLNTILYIMMNSFRYL